MLLIAHQYSRHLGDLYGGQQMGRMARKSLGLEHGGGTAFYNFEQIPVPKHFITGWSSKLNHFELTDAEKQAIVAEANLVFSLNIGLFEELEGNPMTSMFRLAFDGVMHGLKRKL